MEHKLIRSLVLSFATGLVVTIIVQSCKITQAGAAIPVHNIHTTDIVRSEQPPVYINHYYVQPKRDTARNQEKLRKYLSEQYRANYEQFFAPEFRKLSDIINKQADMINSLRIQATMHNDSVTAQNKAYISAALQSAVLANRYQKEAITSKKEYIEAKKEYDSKIQEQIDSNNRQAGIYITGVMVLYSLLIILFLYCRNRFKTIERRLSYV